MTDDDPDRRPSDGAHYSSPELQWLRPYAAKGGETCPACGYAFIGGEPFCGRMCEVLDPAVRWEVVILMADLNPEDSAVLGYRVHLDGAPFTEHENALADTETRSESAVGFALEVARGDAGAWPWRKP